MITIDNIVCALVAFKKTPETVVGGIRWKIWKWYCKRKIRKFLKELVNVQPCGIRQSTKDEQRIFMRIKKKIFKEI